MSRRALLLLSACIGAPAPLRGQQATPGGHDSTVVVLLGTGNPRPEPDASGPATAVVVGARVFLVDAGPGVERRLAAAHLPIDGVTALFITHLHSDHTLGLPDLIFTSWVMGRKQPLAAYGPHGLRQMTDHLVAAWAEDIEVRTNGLEKRTPGGYRVDVHEIRPGVAYDSGGVRVTAFLVEHGTWREAYGYRVDAPGRSVVVSGDTKPSENLVRAAAGADVLVHEVYPEPRTAPNPTESATWPTYMGDFHTSDVELGQLAARIRPKLLILTHIIRRGATDEELLANVRKSFSGRAVVAHDLDRY
ncbi:MAG: MBL fold metallo-hydrolase [Gemmatimonadetes bacterium]|nr:MAG: MBL fold metallo-hydrolase [Gemmatimonadota bacterium]